MNAVLVVLHVVVCFFLIVVVLIQRGKGAEVGAVFGGGASSTIFGSRGAGNFLTKLTTGSAIIFMVTSLTLSYIATDRNSSQLFQDGIESEAAVEEPLFEELGTVDPASSAAAEGADGAVEGDAAATVTSEPIEAAPAETPPAGGATE